MQELSNAQALPAQEESTESSSVLWQVVRGSIFVGFHFTPLLVYWVGVSWQAVGLCVLMYYVRMFGLTAGYHRYFAHRSFQTSRLMQFLLALLGTLALQKGPLWWAGHHVNHHKYSDKEKDPHSVARDGLFWAHIGWIMSRKYVGVPWRNVQRFARYPELVALNTFWQPLFVLMCVLFYFALGFQALVWGCFISTVLLWHGTFCVNSLNHLWGRKEYDTDDESRNNAFIALFTMGEGWHNNHHYYQKSARQGFHWWQLDFTWWILLVMEFFGLIWDVRRPSQEIVEGNKRGKKRLVTA